MSTIDISKDISIYLLNDHKNIITYDKENTIVTYRIDLNNSSSNFINKIAETKQQFAISKILANSKDNKFVLLNIQSYHDSIFGFQIPPKKDTIIKGKKRQIGRNTWWTNSSYIFDIEKNRLIDSIPGNSQAKFAPDSNQIVFIDKKQFDTTFLGLYDIEKHSYKKRSGNSISKIKAIAYSPAKRLFAAVTEQGRIQITNLENSNSIIYIGPNNTLYGFPIPYSNVKSIEFSKSGKFLVLNTYHYFLILNSSDLSLHYISSYYATNICTRILQTNDESFVFFEFGDALYSFEFASKKFIRVYEKVNDSEFTSLNCFFLNDSLLIMKYGAKLFDSVQIEALKKTKGFIKIPPE